jgi:anti-anti-sigma factor
MYPRPCLEVRRQGDKTFIRFAGLDRLDEYNSHVPGEELARLAKDSPCARFVLDLANIRFVTGSALGRLVGLNRKVRAAGGRLVLSNLNPLVAQVIAVTRLDKVLELCGEDTARLSQRERSGLAKTGDAI